MEEQVVSMIRDSLDELNQTCRGIREDMKDIRQDMNEHAKADATYWQKIDQQEGAVSAWKWVAGLGGGSGALAAISQFLGKH